MNERELSGKVAIVTGASRNLGRGIALMLGRMGARVLVHHHGGTSTKEAEETARAVAGAGGEALTCAADLAEPPEVTALVERALQHFGRFDILVNNAGVIL